MDINRLENYWKTTKYRLPEDPAVREFVSSKIKIIQRFIPLRGVNILDVGCGNGTFMHYFASAPALKITGLDISDAMLSKNSSDNLIKASAEDLPFKNNSFDLVFEANLLHHTKNPEKILQEMKRVTKTYMVLIEPNRINPVMFLFSLFNKVERRGLRSSQKYIRYLLKRASLDLIYITSQGVITQNNTPKFLIPILKLFEKEFFYGAYIIAISQKYNGT